MASDSSGAGGGARPLSPSSCLEAQLAEAELLSSIFGSEAAPAAPPDGFVYATEPRARSALGDKPMECTVSIGTAGAHAAVLVCSMPPLYPNVPPTVSVRCDALDKQTSRGLNGAISAFIAANFEPGVASLFDVAQFAQGAVADALASAPAAPSDADSNGAGDTGAAPAAGDSAGTSTPATDTSDMVAAAGSKVEEGEGGVGTRTGGDVEVREWIYFHHVYSREKRRCMLKWAGELGITGFCMVGKPGLALVEGSADSVRQFHSRVKALHWQRMTQRLREEYGQPGRDPCDTRRFEGFRELHMDDGGKRTKRSSLGQLRAVLDSVGLGDRFGEVFRMDTTVAAGAHVDRSGGVPQS